MTNLYHCDAAPFTRRISAARRTIHKPSTKRAGAN